MNDHDIVVAIQDLLDGQVWTPDTLAEIAKLLQDNGYSIGETTP
jgi:hypothetical protein